MGKIKSIFTNFRVIILISALLLGLFAIYPDPWNEGVAIRSIAKNSTAEHAGMQAPKATIAPMGYEIITAINNKPISTLNEYYAIVETLTPNQTVTIRTDKGRYTLLTRPLYLTTTLNETEKILVNETIEEEINGTLINITAEKTILQNKTITKIIGTEPIGIGISEAPKSNLKKGLDLQGGTRLILRPEGNVTPELISDIIDVLKERLNVYGLSDVVVTDVVGSNSIIGGEERFILVEIAGATEEELTKLIPEQGKFEAKIGNTTVFEGGANDITYICRTADCSGIDPQRGCTGTQGAYSCAFQFAITLSPEAAQMQADTTRNMQIIGDVLSEPLRLIVDGQEVDSLSIASSLRGQAATEIAISGGGAGITEQAAMEDALANMKRMQTILKTGSLPVKLHVERADTISPTLGNEFLSNAFFVGMLCLIGVSTVIVIVYRKLVIAIPIMITALSEIFLTLAVAALIGWNIDLAAIAGIILAVGMGVNDQIIITDEAIRKEGGVVYNWKDRIKRAFFIIMSAYFTQLFAMIPLFFAGAGLLKGFALTTILAITVGVFITRPAYAAIVGKLVE